MVDIDDDVSGLILIGRREMKGRAAKSRRRQMRKEHDTDIHSYDFLVDAARGRAEAMKKHAHRQPYRRGRQDRGQ